MYNMQKLRSIQTTSKVLVMFCNLIGLCPGHAEDWPEFRGPFKNGVSKSNQLPTIWHYDPSGNSSTNIVWKSIIPGQGWSSPVIAHNQVFLTSAVREGSKIKLHALALELRSGKTLWNTEIFASDSIPSIHQKNGNASPTPVVVNRRVYVHFGHFGTACLTLDGKVVWKNNELLYSPVHGNGGSPVVAENSLVFSCDGAENPFVAALDTKTGKLKWKTVRITDAKKKFSFSTPTVVEVAGTKQIISPGSGAVCAYDPKSGEEIWRVRYGEGYSVVPKPIYANGMIYVATGYDRPTVMAIKPGGKGDVTDTHVAWTAARGAPNTPSLLHIDQRLYMLSDAGILSCLNALSGEQIWQERIGGNFSASPILAGDRIYLQNEEGVATVLDAGPDFKVISKNSLGERSLASYAVTDGALIIRTAQHLFRIGKIKG